jgi:BirA family biotin operon repressor/biotin-[acetyl-CoA-carboxylase] ligase
MFTTIFRPSLKVEQIQRVVMLCGLAIAEVCEAKTGMKVDVKWPNDLLIGSKKMTGILPESALLSDEPEWVNVGTGINVNQMIDPADPLFETATSLMMACGQVINREELFVAIMEKYAGWYKKLAKDSLLNAWRGRCITLGQQVQVGLPTGILTGTATTILVDGALLVMGKDGSEYPVHASEATIIKS